MMQEWQKYSGGHKDIPPFPLLLEFMDLQACDKLKRPAVNPNKKTAKVSYVTTMVKDCCVVCKTGKHPLHACKSFQAGRWQLSRRTCYAIAWSQGTFLGSALVSTDAKCVKIHTTHSSILTGAMKGNWTAPSCPHLMINKGESSWCTLQIQAATTKCCYQHAKWRWLALMAPLLDSVMCRSNYLMSCP